MLALPCINFLHYNQRKIISTQKNGRKPALLRHLWGRRSMKNILKFRFLSRFVMLFLFIFGLNTALSTPALAAEDLEVDVSSVAQYGVTTKVGSLGYSNGSALIKQTSELVSYDANKFDGQKAPPIDILYWCWVPVTYDNDMCADFYYNPEKCSPFRAGLIIPKGAGADQITLHVADMCSTTLDYIYLTYDGNGATGGSAPKSPLYVTNLQSNTFALPANTYTKNGYDFVGWSLNDRKLYGSNYTFDYGFGDLFDGTHTGTTKTLKAEWHQNTYTVTLNKEPGSNGPTSITVVVGSELPNITIPERAGYEFCGYGVYSEKDDWVLYYTETGANVRSYREEYGTSWDECWTPKTYDVTLIAEGCDGYPKTVQMTTGTLMSDLPESIAAKTCSHGGAFSGWWDTDDFTSEDAIPYYPTDTYSPNAGWGATTLYAAFSYPVSECAPGEYLPKNTSSHDSSACEPCTAGFYCGGGRYTWDPLIDQGIEKCPNGYNSRTGMAADKEDCYIKTTAGYYIETAKSSTQVPCPAGYKCPSTEIKYGATGGKIMCNAGTYAAGGASECKPCSAGYYCPEDAMAQQKVCPENTYTESTRAKACTDCETGYTTSGTTYENHNEKADCKITCSAGTYVKDVDGACTAVGIGYYMPEHTVDSGKTDTRGECVDGGTTLTTTSGSSASCFKNITCETTSNGVIASGKKTCYYSNGAYSNCTSECIIDNCGVGKEVINGKCENKKYKLILDADYVEGGYLPVGAVTYLDVTYDTVISESAPNAPIPLKPGYKFLGWYDANQIIYYDENGDLEFTSVYKTDGNTTLYPKWTPAQYTIVYQSYNQNTNTTSTLGTQTCYYGSECYVGKELGDVLNQTGSTFDGTWEVEDCSVTSEIRNDVDLNEVWNSCTLEFAELGRDVGFKANIVQNVYYLRYHANGGSPEGLDDTRCTYGFYCDVTDVVFVKEGSFFKGWSEDPTATNETYLSGQKVKNLRSSANAVVDLYAVYGVCEPCAPGEGAECRLSTVTGACKYTTWCKEGFESIQNEDSYNPVCSRKTITIPVYKTTISTTPEKVITLTYGDSLPELFTWDAVREGYDFAGLISEGGIEYYDKNGNRSYGSGYPEKLTGQWSANTYKVTFNTDGADNAGTKATWYKYEQDQDCIYYADSGTTECLSEDKGIYIAPPSKTGYEFDGYTDSNGTEYVDSTGTMVNNLYRMRAAPTTLQSQWTPNTYNLCFDANGGSGAPGCMDVTYNGQLQKINVSNMSRQGYKFMGFGIYNEGKGEWSDKYYDENGNPKMEYQTASDLTLYAIWVPYSVKLIYNCGGKDKGQQTTGVIECFSDAPCELPESTCNYEGYKFKEWKVICNNCGENGKIYVSPGVDISEHITLDEDGIDWDVEAVWEERPKMTFYLDAGPCTPPENTSITIYEDQLDELFTILGSDKNVPNCDNIGGTFNDGYYIDLGDDADPCYIDGNGSSCTQMLSDGDTLHANVTYTPIECKAGEYLKAGTISSCSPCDKGSYCIGSGNGFFWWNPTEDQGIEKCPENYTSDWGKAVFDTDCYADLKSGEYVETAKTITFSTCPKGSICDAKQRVYWGDTGGISKCPQGSYCPEEGMSQGYLCQKGYHCPTIGLTEQKVCSGDTYSDTEGLSKCKSCKTGYSISGELYTDHDNQTDCKISCDPGYYLVANAESCSAVGYNYYSVGGTAAYGSSIPRAQCPDGGLTDTETASNSAACYIENECSELNGIGTKICKYTASGYTDCGSCSLTSCDPGFKKDSSGVCIIQPITIHYQCDGKTDSASKTCYVNDTSCKLDYTGCVNKGYVLDTWNIDADGYYDDFVGIDTDLIQYGIFNSLPDIFWDDGAHIMVSPRDWTPNEITIIYTANGEEVYRHTCNYGTSCPVATHLATPTQVGGVFAGWGDENTIYAPGDALNLPESGEYLLRAEFNPIKYAIGYHQNTGVGEQIAHTPNCEYDQGCKLTTSFYTKDGSAFLGWSTDPNATTAEYKSGASVMNLTSINGAVVTLYAVYGKCEPCSTEKGVWCRFSTSTGSCVYTSGCNTGYKLLSRPNISNPICEPLDVNVEVYETELSRTPLQTLALTYGSVLPDTISVPQQREGYTFNGFVGDDNTLYYNGQGVRQSDKLLGTSLTLYGTWSANKYQITFESNGATYKGTQEAWYKYEQDQNCIYYADSGTTECLSEDKGIYIDPPSKTGHIFNGYTDENDEVVINSSGVFVRNLYSLRPSNSKLYAQWTQNVFSVDIEYNCGDGSGSAPALQTCLSTDDKCLLAQTSCKKDGYIFMGWMFDGELKNAGDNVLSYATSENDDKTFEATAVYTKSEFEIKTTSTTQTFNFTLAAAGTFYIDWGDGKTQVINKTDLPTQSYSHEYETAGTYDIKFAGHATQYNAGNVNASSISFEGNKNIAGISGSLGAMFGTLNNPENGEIQPRFRNAFYGCANLTSEIPADLFSGISGQPSRRMFQNTFSGTKISGSIPEGLFAGIVGSVTDYLFYHTFQYCSKLTGQIPVDLFAGITGELTSTTTTQLAFSGTFWNAGVGADEQGNPLTIPNGLFSGLSTTNYISGQMANIFTGTKFATACPGGGYKVTAPENPFVADWSEKAMCNTCPSDTSRKVTTDAGNNNGINSCYAACPTSITITNGTTAAVNTKENYDGTKYPACTYNVACNTGYDAINNGSTKPSCAAHTYTVTYVEDTANVSVDAVFGQPFTFSRPTPVKTGYTGTGWQDVTGKIYSLNEQIIYNKARDMSVTPAYKANEYNAIYDCGNGTDNVTEKVAYDDDYTLKTDICTQPGRTFVGWSVDGVHVSNAFVWKYTHDVTFTARYSNNAYECKPGYYLPQGGTICNAECETGSYCPGGVFEYTGEEQGMNPCPQYSDSVSGASACTCYTGFTVDGIVGGNNMTTEHACMLAPQFVVTTTAKTTSFRFNIAAKGKFWVDCGDGGAVKEIDRTKIDFDTDYISDANTAYTCKYSKPGMYEIKFAGRASGYDKTHRQEPTYSAIRFSEYYANDTYNEGLETIHSISGSLGAIFPTLKDGTNPTFYGTFAGQTAMTGEIPSTLFDGIHGKPVEYMFEQTFANCIGLTGDIPATLFAGLDGAAAKFTFYQTFYQCAGLTGIPSDLFKGVKGDPAYGMFSNTFRGCSGLTGSIPEDLFANVYGAPAERMFVETFTGCSGLTGPIPAGLFRGITGDAAPYMFFKTFDGCTGLTGNIPHDLFRGITGAPKISMFRGTFHNCSGLTGSIPSDLFAGIKGEAATTMFVDTFYGCSGIDGYVPTELFANITNNSGLTGTIKNIFLGTSIATQCPTDQYKVVSEFSNQWGDYVACNTCPGVGTIESDGQYGIEMCHALIPCNENGAGTKDCKYNTITSQYDVGCTACEYSACVDGYYLNNGICEICPVGSYCANSIKNVCPDTYTTESTGAVLDTECFANCADKEVIYGTGYIDKPLVFLPEVCTHTYGISVTGNPCKIIDNVCVETSCNYDYEMINGKCELCVRDNALTFKSGAGNCVVESCLYGYHPFGQSCVPNTRECSIDGALSAEQKWDTKTNNFGPCMVTECAEGYHIDANTCVLDVQTCELENGMGEKVYNHDLKKWGDCVVTTCKPGYTNDPLQTNETWKQCGQCNNMFGANGERAVSSYLTECEIASCMYQGEKYILENNECVLICDERSDETGSRHWNGNKCVHECKPGFLTW